MEAAGSYWRTKFQPDIDAQDRLHFFLDGLVSSSLRDFWTSLEDLEELTKKKLVFIGDYCVNIMILILLLYSAWKPKETDSI